MLEEHLLLWLACLLIAMPVFAIAWWRQLQTRNANAVDACWVQAVTLTAVILLSYAWQGGARHDLTLILIALWGGRLSWYLVSDRLIGAQAEDSRYAALRQAKGAAWPVWSFFFYQAQALVAMIYAAPALVAAVAPVTMSWWSWIGAAIALLAWLGEISADRQLARWKRQPANAGRSCRRGWWRYSRHPNYFFEFLFWSGIATLACSGGWTALVFIHPVGVYVLVRWLTGVPYSEERALARRGEDYRRYQQETPVFWPWWPASTAPSGKETP